MEGTYLQHLPKDLRDALIRFGGQWPTYLEQLPPELRKSLIPHLKGVWFRAQVIPGPSDATLVLTDLIFVEPGKRVSVIKKFEIPFDELLWNNHLSGDTTISIDPSGVTVQQPDIQEIYSVSIASLFVLKVVRVALDLGEKYVKNYRYITEKIAAQEDPRYVLTGLANIYEDTV